MLLREAMRKQGQWLFRSRSYVPLLLLPLAFIAAANSGALARWLGDPLEDYWDVMCLAVSFVGLLVRIATVGAAPQGTSGRNRKEQRADVLNTTGLYSIVRNPLYLGNLLMLLGLTLLTAVWWFVLLACVSFFLYYERIVFAEEAYLEEKFGDDYRRWAARTPMILPRPWLWRSSAHRFSWRKALRQEYSGFYVIVIAATILDFTCDLLGAKESFMLWLHDDQEWITFLVVGTFVYLSLRLLRHHTSLLVVRSDSGGITTP